MESLQNRILKQGLVSVVVISLSVCSSSVVSVAAQASTESESESTILLEETKKEKVTTSVSGNTRTTTSEPDPFVVTDPAVTVDSGEGVDGMTMLYIGGAIGLVAIGAMALGGGSGSSSEATPAPPAIPVVGPDLNGTNWGGYLELKNTEAQGYQNIAAGIVHSGTSVQITTTSTLLYGQLFNGRINSRGDMTMYDSVTGQDWTTHYHKASENSIDLYDYVNGLKDLDRMLLIR